MGYILSYAMDLGPWSWLILGGALLAIEVLFPGTFMLWFGLAAIATGLLSFILPLSLQVQIVVFVIFSLISVLIGRRLLKNQMDSTDQPLLNKRAQQLIGGVYQVTTAISGGRGKIKVGDSLWVAKGADAPEGSMVRVTAIDGNHLLVEPAES